MENEIQQQIHKYNVLSPALCSSQGQWAEYRKSQQTVSQKKVMV